jgi:hypothetical protein
MSNQLIAESKEFSSHDLHSESTLPLLNFLLRSRKEYSAEKTNEIIHSVTAGIGIDKKPPIPDESEILRTNYINLINHGPSGTGTKISGMPTVSILSKVFFQK